MPFGWEPCVLLGAVALLPLILRGISALGDRLERWVFTTRFADKYKEQR